MKEFVYGSDHQYELLKESLEDHLCHVYSRCYLPGACSKNIARIGFEKEENTYALFIDKGIYLFKLRGLKRGTATDVLSFNI